MFFLLRENSFGSIKVYKKLSLIDEKQTENVICFLKIARNYTSNL